MREFVAAGGEMIIHAASLSKNTPTPEVINFKISAEKYLMVGIVPCIASSGGQDFLRLPNGR